MAFSGRSNWVSGSLWNGEYFIPLTSSILLGTGLSASSTADGKMTITNTGQSFDPSASYITLGPTGSLANERTLAAGPGIFITDYGAGNNVAISASLLAGPNITINQVSNSYAISASFSALAVTGTWFEGTPSPRLRTTASVAIGSGTGFAQDFGSNIFFYVSGSRAGTTGISVFGGDVLVSGAVDIRSSAVITGTLNVSNIISASVGMSTPWFTGSLVNLQNGQSYLLAGSGITTATASNGQVTIATTGLAPSNAQYLVLATDATLTAERVITLGNGLSASDGGANGNWTLSTTQWLESATAPRLRTTASIAIGAGAVFAQDKGTNVVFYVSGTLATSASSAILPSTTISGTVTSFGGWIDVPTIVTGPYTILPDDSTIACSGASSYTITLPTVAEFGRYYFIKDVRGNASTANIIISCSNGVIDGASTWNMAVNYESVRVQYFGAPTHWGIT